MVVFNSWLQQESSRDGSVTINIGVVGYGYVGAAVANGFLTHGYKVSVSDIDDNKKKASLIKGFRFNESLASLVEESDVIFLCLPTPSKPTGHGDISSVEKVFGQICDLNVREEKIVVIKSTVPPGTTARLDKMKKGNIKVVFCPEFLREETAFEDFLNPDRIVVSGFASDAVEKVCALHYPFGVNIVRTDPTSAEMAKYASNIFLAMKVSYTNEIKNIAEKVGANPKDVMHIVGLDKRIGRSHLDPTKGPYGGSCLPKDIKALIAHATDVGYDPVLLRAVEYVNQKEMEKRQPKS